MKGLKLTRTVTGVIPRAVTSDAAVPGLLSSTGFLPMALGVAILLWGAWDFATAGPGTRADHAPRRLVVRYRFVRNPMYVGALTVLFSESIVFRSTHVEVRSVVRRVSKKGAAVDTAEW